MKKLFSFLRVTYLWTQPVAFAVLLLLFKISNVQGVETLFALLILSFLPCAVINISASRQPSSKLSQEERQREQSQQKIPAEMRKTQPEAGDLILGRFKRDYICTSLEHTDSHYAIIGTSGTGKTSCYLLNNLILNHDTGALVLDVKDNELYRKATRRGDTTVLRFAPEDQDAYGYDPFYALADNPTNTDILQVIQLISHSIISIPADSKDRFWPTAARNMFCGLAIHHYKQGLHDLISIVDAILGQPITLSITTALKFSTQTDPEYRYLIMFQGMSPATLYGVYSELAANLTVFSNHPGLRYALRDNPKKITPLDLERGKQVFLCVDQTELTAMNGAVKLILDQMLYAMQRRMRGRTESEVPPLLFIIDELPQLLTNGPLEQLIQGLRVLRSSKVRMILAFQTIESLETAYSHSQVVDLCSNCNHMIILNGGNSTATLEMVCSLAGQFSEKRQSVSSGSHGSTTTSFEEKNILTPAEINRLPQQGKALILSPSGYMIVEKSPYYQCKYIQPMAADIERHNRQIQEVEGGNIHGRAGDEPSGIGRFAGAAAGEDGGEAGGGAGAEGAHPQADRHRRHAGQPASVPDGAGR